MADRIPGEDPRARLALGLGRVAHGLFRLILAAFLFGAPALLLVLLWAWLRG